MTGVCETLSGIQEVNKDHLFISMLEKKVQLGGKQQS